MLSFVLLRSSCRSCDLVGGFYTRVFNTWFLGRPGIAEFRVWAASAAGKPLPKGGALRAPPFGKGCWAAGAAQTPNIDYFRSAQKPCMKNPSVLFSSGRACDLIGGSVALPGHIVAQGLQGRWNCRRPRHKARHVRSKPLPRPGGGDWADPREDNMINPSVGFWPIFGPGSLGNGSGSKIVQVASQNSPGDEV